MRIQSTFVFITLLALAVMAVLNLGALTEPTGLSLGWRQFTQTSLALAVLGLLLALVGGAVDQRRSQEAVHQAENELYAQRALADKAEGSRMAELQRHLDLQAQAAEHREREMLARIHARLVQVQQDLQHRLDEVGNSLGAYIGEVEDRLERRKLLRPPPAARPDHERH